MEFVTAGWNAASPWEDLNCRIFPRDGEFVKRVRTGMHHRKDDIKFPKRNAVPFPRPCTKSHPPMASAIERLSPRTLPPARIPGSGLEISWVCISPPLGNIVLKAGESEVGETRQRISKG